MARKAQTTPAAEAEQDEGVLNLREAAAYLGVTDQRVRSLLREERIQAFKNEKGYWRVRTDELDKYNATKGQRRSGAKAFVLRLTPEQVEELTEFINMNDWEDVNFEPRYKYDPKKAKAYREKRKEEQAAEEAEASE